jgi:sulfate transport system permease protein
LPSAVARIALTALYAKNGWLGQYIEPFGIKVAFNPLGVLVVLVFIDLAFVVRTVQPVLEDLLFGQAALPGCLADTLDDLLRQAVGVGFVCFLSLRGYDEPEILPSSVGVSSLEP